MCTLFGIAYFLTKKSLRARTGQWCVLLSHPRATTTMDPGRLVTIVNNMVFTLDRLHIRCEDCISRQTGGQSPTHAQSFGVVIQRIVMNTQVRHFVGLFRMQWSNRWAENLYCEVFVLNALFAMLSLWLKNVGS